MLASAFILFRFQPEDIPKLRSMCRVGRLATLLIASVFAIGSTPKPSDAGLWDAAKEWYLDFQLGEVNEASIFETPVEYVGGAELILQGQFSLAFDEGTPGIGDVGWMGFSPEGTLLITDSVGHLAFEFSRTDGQYIRSFGRRGKGPGEYLSSRNMDIDPQGRVYLLNHAEGWITRYDRQGQYLDRIRSFRTSQILTGLGGEVFVLNANKMKIMAVQRLDPITWEVLYRIPLSTDKQQFLAFRYFGFAHLCYSPTRHRLYYLGPNDYLIKEIDADTGAIIRQFGLQPEGFVPLPKRYYGIGRGSLEDIRELEISTLASMLLVQDRYLCIYYTHPIVTTNESYWEGLVYDLKASSPIYAYTFKMPLRSTPIPGGIMLTWVGDEVATWQDRIYRWRQPSAETAEHSNGTVEVYELSFSIPD